MTLEQLQKEARERFESLFTKNGELSPSVSIVTLKDNNDALIAKAFLAGKKSGKSEGAKIAIEYAFSRIKEEGVIEGDDIRISHEQLAGILEVGRMKARTK